MFSHLADKKKVKGILYIVSTPIGNLEDITLRAIEVLKNVDIIAAETPKITKRLLDKYNINTKLIMNNKNNERIKKNLFINKLEQGFNIALVSDAGTPCINDPGAELLTLAQQKEISISVVPGPNAAIAALSLTGLYKDSFYFHGFLPKKNNEKKEYIRNFFNRDTINIFYESQHRLVDTFDDLASVFNKSIKLFLIKEITKLHESFNFDSIENLKKMILENKKMLNGEFVLIFPKLEVVKISTDIEDYLDIIEPLIGKLPIRTISKIFSKRTNMSTNLLYDYLNNFKQKRDGKK